VNDLFNRTGLVVLSMDHAELKRRFIPVMEKELMERPSKGFVEAATQQLEEAGFSGQAFPREINLFYLKDQLRERIVWEENSFRVLNTDLTFSPEEMKHELHQHPQRFSPNVVIRPLYQEYILPNLAYIGGGGEIAYWLERKAQFEHFGINFPMLIRRNSVLWIDKGNAKRMNKLDLSLSDLLGDTEALIKDFVKEESDNQLSLKEEKRQLAQLFQGVINRVKAVDPTLVATVKAEIAKQQKSLDQMEGKLIRAEKQKYEIAINQIRNLKDRLFPNNGLQERYDNFMAFYLKHGEAYFNILLEHLDPMKKELLVVIED
jgi:bacillithiol biosynthesis cysteine-adding enzyme BshC